MPMIVIVGAQWGDEGKGKIVDLYAKNAEVVARYGGGANAGHTLVVNGEKTILHLVPSGILQGKVCVLGNGMVIDPKILLDEIGQLKEKGYDVSPQKLMISNGAHICLPTHKLIDQTSELEKGNKKIGTTLRGIGPAYVNKMGRVGLRAGLMRTPVAFTEAVKSLVELHNRELARFTTAGNPTEIMKDYLDYAKQLVPYIKDTSRYLSKRLAEGANVLAEGAQSVLLDPDFGSYPFVTSSSTGVGGVLNGLGVDYKYIQNVIGVTKAYATRVGEGPFPTELLDSHGEDLRQKGGEYGATTGRPRRVGLLDLPALRYAIRVGCIRELIMTKLDILSGLPNIKLCVAYQKDGGHTCQEIPEFGMDELGSFLPSYEDVLGWSEDISRVKEWRDLPATVRFYIQRVSRLVEVPISLISVGAGRDQVIRCNIQSDEKRYSLHE